MNDGKRPYRSRRRREQAAETREKILAAARKLFVSAGYGQTTIESIAVEAGVAVPTVYATLGSKRGLLMALLDQMAEAANRPRMLAALEAARGDPRRQLREVLAFSVRLYVRGADIIGIARAVAGVEPDLRDLWEEGEARRYRAVRALAKEWQASGALVPGLTRQQATDTVWALAGPDVFRLFVVQRRWSRSRYEEWLGKTLEGLLFGPL